MILHKNIFSIFICLFIFSSYLNSMETDDSSNLNPRETSIYSKDTTWGNQIARRKTVCNTDKQSLLSILCIFTTNSSSPPIIGLPMTFSWWKNWKYKRDTTNYLFKEILNCFHNEGFETLAIHNNAVTLLKELGVEENLFIQTEEDDKIIFIKTQLTQHKHSHKQ